MKKIFFEYYKLWRRYYYSDNKIWIIDKFFMFYFLFPVFLWIIIFFLLSYFDNSFFWKLFEGSSQELLNTFSMMSWFLLTTIWIILTNTWNISWEEWNKKDIILLNKLKENLGKKEDYQVIVFLKEAKKLFIFEICLQFILILLITIMISIVKVYPLYNWMNLFLIVLFSLSINLSIRLIINFVHYCNATEFQ